MGTLVQPHIRPRLSSRTSHFVLPKQWASMRKAEALERDTGKRVIHFEKGDFQGEEFRPAPHIMEACAKAIADGHVRYVPGPGLPELRDAIAEEATKRGRPTVREEVLVTMGAKHALTQSLLTVVDQGDEVIFPNPGYPPDEFWITYAGGTVVYAPLVEPDFHFDLDSLQSLITPKTKMLIINTPQRPNGMTVGQLEEIAAICAEHNVIVLTDEIFSHMVYAPAEHRTIAAVAGMADRSILVDTFSKTYIMTGFRIGWCVANKDLITTMDIFQQNSVTNVPAFVQLAALAAITGPQDHVAAITARLQAKRDKTVAALNAMDGIECPTPEGSFYVFPDIRGTGMTAQQFADHLIENHQVGVVAGSAFGDRGEGHIRLTYAVPGRRPRGGPRPHPPGPGEPLATREGDPRWRESRTSRGRRRRTRSSATRLSGCAGSGGRSRTSIRPSPTSPGSSPPWALSSGPCSSPTRLDAKLKERIILRVSILNRSAYCTHAHEQISAKMGFTPREIAEMHDPDTADIRDDERAALAYAQELTLSPGDIAEGTFSALRGHFSESQIVEITMVAALYNMINRFNEALKLDPEEY